MCQLSSLCCCIYIYENKNIQDLPLFSHASQENGSSKLLKLRIIHMSNFNFFFTNNNRKMFKKGILNDIAGLHELTNGYILYYKLKMFAQAFCTGAYIEAIRATLHHRYGFVYR